MPHVAASSLEAHAPWPPGCAAGREAALVALEAALDAKEAELAAVFPGGEAGSVAALRWAALLEQRRGAAARWAAHAAHAAALRGAVALAAGARRSTVPPRAIAQMSRKAADDNAPAADDNCAVDDEAPPPLPLVQLSGPTCACWSVQQVELVSLGQQQQQADLPCASCCFQR
jgi:hypothetical protein